jgi:protein-S-isoprenylcysteine O-methyltransferase Ste14
MDRHLARLRVPLGFACAAVALALARPTWASWCVGAPVAVVGECLRCWAAGHIEKGREITSSGPYRFVRHPLYLGSAIIGLGFVIAAGSPIVALVTIAYVALTIPAAIRSEEAALDETFRGGYAAYRAGQAAMSTRAFSWRRVWMNREHKAVAGLALVIVFLAVRVR